MLRLPGLMVPSDAARAAQFNKGPLGTSAPERVVIRGIVSPDTQYFKPRRTDTTDEWWFSCALDVWRLVGQDPIYCSRLGLIAFFESETQPDVSLGVDTIIECEAYTWKFHGEPTVPATVAIMLPPVHVATDAALVEAASRFFSLDPVKSRILGELRMDRRSGEFVGKDVPGFPGVTAGVSTVDRESVARILAGFDAKWLRLQDCTDAFRHFAAVDLTSGEYGIVDDGVDEFLSVPECEEALALMAIRLRCDGKIEVVFYDGGIAAGHAITVVGDSEVGPERLTIDG